jgi:hypothetical protein
MRGMTLAIGLALVVAAYSPLARADAPPAVGGLAVVALAGATDAAWPLAGEVYSDASVRPATIDEQHARVLCGEAAPSDAPVELRDLAEVVAGLRGDDPRSRALLGEVARRFSVRAVLVVRVDEGHPTARVFLADTGAFDAGTFAPDGSAHLSWSAAVHSIARIYASDPTPRQTVSAPVVVRAPPLATQERPGTAFSPGRGPQQGTDPGSLRRREFYESGWFWGALGGAAFAGGAVFLATRDSSPSAIHLHVEVPR